MAKQITLRFQPFVCVCGEAHGDVAIVLSPRQMKALPWAVCAPTGVCRRYSEPFQGTGTALVTTTPREGALEYGFDYCPTGIQRVYKDGEPLTRNVFPILSEVLHKLGRPAKVWVTVKREEVGANV